MKPLIFDLEDLNLQNKDLDVGLDALKHNLDLFLQETCLLTESVVIFANSYIHNMTYFWANIWSIDGSVSHESKII